ncbi:urea amidolyase family protein [Cellulomonas sp. IC4_254]|uniref:5-oxoprolinase subunit B/C family protein n=1 Tax=Cellulomonas sp. IC4_254 TaxID=2714040 RepID=UPI001423DD1A|nr:urea amidolyase family protein [Cellulomonas sp. IC4_254]NHT17060.1 5-oxoprolinase/urea amidolyase family protein [Cellulomonas sp. IC4_254]
MTADDPGDAVRVVPYGVDALLVDLPGLTVVRALDDALRSEPPPGVTDVVPAARTVLVRFATPADARDAVDAVLTAARAAGSRSRDQAAPGHPDSATPADPVVLPVRYDGPDLAAVARATGLTEREVVRRHAAGEYTVAFGGFMPGFAYLTGLDPALHVPRRATPRERVPPGAVAIAGEFAAVYPAATPGGWMLLGTCDVPLFDVDRDPPALLRPGTRVRFAAVSTSPSGAAAAPQVARAHVDTPHPDGPPVDGPQVDPARVGPVQVGPAQLPPTTTALDPGVARHPRAAHAPGGAHDPDAAPRPEVEVLATGPLVLVQDRGRPGLAAVGVGRSGSADAGALRLANRLVGNGPGAAGLEVLLGGLVLRFPAGGVVALAGAEVPADVDGVPVAPHAATRVPPGGVLRTSTAARGLRLYVAVRGGLDVPPVLGSRAADRLAGIGPAPLRVGDTLPVGTDVVGSAQPWADAPRDWPGTVVLRVAPGPRPDWFAPGEFERLLAGRFAVSPASDRVALRLDGPPVERADRGELPSEPLVPGAVQVPPDGRPVVFGVDHPVTGGYPVVAVVEPRSRDRAAQLRPGDTVRFARFEGSAGHA